MRTIPFLAACALIVTLVSLARADTNSSPSISLEGIYWRPAGLDFPVIEPANPAGANRNGTAQGIEYGFAPGYHLTIQWRNFRASWIDLQTQSNFNAQCASGAGNCMRTSQRGSLGEFIGYGAASASAWSATRLQMFDLDFLKSFGAGSAPSFIASFGLRYARIYNGTDTFYRFTPGLTDDLQSRTINNMIGMRTGLEGIYQIRSTFRLMGSAAISLLSGRSHNDATEIGTTLGISQTGATYNTIAPVIEMGLKLAWTPIEDCDAWLGYDFLEFSNGLVQQTYVGTAAASSAQVTRQNISFMGPNLGLRWRFF